MIEENKNLVSVCVPVYNGQQFLEQTLVSIIAQTYTNIEILVGDNASEDNTPGIIEKLALQDNRIKHLRIEQNISFAANCNRLINQSSGEFIAIYHADDVYDQGIVEKQLVYLHQKKHLAGVFTLAKTINSKGDLLRKKIFTLKSLKNKTDIEVDKKTYLDAVFNGNCPFLCPTAMIKKNIYKEVGGYNESLKYIEDVDLWLRILDKGNLGILNEKLVKYRFHNQQGSVAYRDNLRKDHGPLINYLQYMVRAESFVNNLTGNAIETYITKLSGLVAFDYIKLAVYAAELSDFARFKKMIACSKDTHRFSLCKIRLFVCQNMYKIVSYSLIKLIRKLSSSSRVF